MIFENYLKCMVGEDASDLYLITDAAPTIKIYGKLKPLQAQHLTAKVIKEIAYNIMSEQQIQAFEKSPEMNLAIADQSIGRFRVNIYRQRNDVAMVVRNIKTEIPSLNALGMPEVMKDLILQKRGLIIFVGAAGSGKSTSLASLINYRNEQACGHIITVEDPIEFNHSHKQSIVTQREIGVDTDNYSDALKHALRQSPEVILIGEARSLDAMEHALTFAETGHLCLTTLHANTANQALDRIIHFFPDSRRNQILLDLSLNLNAIVSQRLIPAIKGGYVAAYEVLLGTTFVSDLIRRGEITELKDVMQKSEHLGMQTMDSSLLKLFEAGKISLDEAIRNADSQNNLRLAISLKSGANCDDSKLSIEKDLENANLFFRDDYVSK